MSTDLQRSLAMFRFNFWPKPFFPPPPGSGGMENSPFVPNPLTSPALMVLASTAAAEGADAQRLPAPPHPHHQHHPSFPGRSMDKDLPPPPPPPPFSTAAFMYRPGDPFSAPLYNPLSFVRPELDRRLALMNPGMRPGAFRPLGPAGSSGDGDTAQGYHSAFSPASSTSSSSGKKLKTEETGGGNGASVLPSSSDLAEHHPHYLASGQSYREEHEDARGCSPPQHGALVKEERPPSLCSSQGYDTVSEPMSDSGDAFDRGTPDSEGRSLRKQRKRASHDGLTPCCPVCGLTLRAGELGAHLMLEIDKLDKLSRGGRKSRDTTPQGRKGLTSPCGSRKGKDSPPPEVASRSRYDTFLRIRCNRQSRLSARRGQKKRRPGEEGVKETICPVCNERLTGATEELNAHVELCLKQRNGCVDEEEPVDVEGEFEEYEWAGQTRVRASSMLEGGFAGSGFQTSKKGSDEDIELNVDGDDTEEYGKPQFSDKDMVPLGADGEGPSTSASTSTSFPPESSFASRTDTVNSDGAGCSTSYEALDLLNCDDGSQSTPALVSALRLKLQDMEAEKTEKQKCLICLEPYKTPLVSIQCWHVHCEQCWMRTLGAKKLCPQCNMITAPGDLRRIYL